MVQGQAGMTLNAVLLMFFLVSPITN